MLLRPTSLRRLLLAIALVSAGCGSDDPSGPPVPGQDPNDGGSTAAAAEAEDFAAAMTEAVTSGELAVFNRLVDWEGMLDEVERSLGLDPALAAEPRARTLEALRGERSLGYQLTQAAKRGGDWSFLRTHQYFGQPRALFRIIYAEGGINYLDMTIDENRADGRLLASDIYSYMGSESVSQTLRRVFGTYLVQEAPERLANLDDGQRAFCEDIRRTIELQQAAARGQASRVRDLFARLPAHLQKEKAAMLLHLDAMATLGDAGTLEAIEDFRRIHPRDPGIEIIALDAHSRRNEFDQALASVARLDEWLGGDPYLDVLRGGIELSRGDSEAALRHGKRALEADPSLVDACWLIVSVTLEAHDHSQTAYWLGIIEKKHGLEIGSLEGIPEYASFVESDAYRTWRLTRVPAQK